MDLFVLSVHSGVELMVGYAYDNSLANVSNMMADSHSKLLCCWER